MPLFDFSIFCSNSNSKLDFIKATQKAQLTNKQQKIIKAFMHSMEEFDDLISEHDKDYIDSIYLDATSVILKRNSYYSHSVYNHAQNTYPIKYHLEAVRRYFHNEEAIILGGGLFLSALFTYGSVLALTKIIINFSTFVVVYGLPITLLLTIIEMPIIIAYCAFGLALFSNKAYAHYRLANDGQLNDIKAFFDEFRAQSVTNPKNILSSLEIKVLLNNRGDKRLTPVLQRTVDVKMVKPTL